MAVTCGYLLLIQLWCNCNGIAVKIDNEHLAPNIPTINSWDHIMSRQHNLKEDCGKTWHDGCDGGHVHYCHYSLITCTVI